MIRPTLLNDIVFKMVFGVEANRSLLQALLNALLGLTGPERITALEILNPKLDREHFGQKGPILDVKARDSRGRLYNIEVQLADRPAYVERALYYLARLLSSQLETGDPYTEVAKTIGISLVDFPLFPELADLHSTYRMYDEKHAKTLTDVLELHFIELVKFRRDKPRQLRTPFERWLHILKFSELYEGGEATLPAQLKAEEGIAMAVRAWRKASASRQVRELLEMREKADHDEATRLEHAKKQGREEGRQEGREVGRREAQKKIARQMRAAGMNREQIQKITGLDVDDLD